jgi:hypothetical protein
MKHLTFFRREGVMRKFGVIGLVFVGFVAGIIFVYSCGGGSSGSADVAALEARIDVLETKLAYLMVDDASIIRGLAPPHVIFRGANVHIQNGTGATDTINGLGNLVIGYNEMHQHSATDRTGSHNLIVGQEHRFTSSGGIVAGFNNAIFGTWSSVLAGYSNQTTGTGASVSGGSGNISSGSAASILGGGSNSATIDVATVSGGTSNEATGLASSISGGFNNRATALRSSVSGGVQNWATAREASVSGGHQNRASFDYSHVSGGSGNIASGQWSSVSGGYANSATGVYSVVSGGDENTASHDYSTISGGTHVSSLSSHDHR